MKTIDETQMMVEDHIKEEIISLTYDIVGEKDMNKVNYIRQQISEYISLYKEINDKK